MMKPRGGNGAMPLDHAKPASIPLEAARPAKGADQQVFGTEHQGRIGRLVRGPAGEGGNELLVARGWWNRRVRRVPRNAVSSSGPEGVRTRLSLAKFLALPGFVPDEDLVLRVRERLSSLPRLRRCGIESLDVRVSEGRVSLTGFVATSGLRRAAGELAAGTWGVVSVSDGLITDSELESRVARAFVAHPRLQPSLVRVSASLGTVLLEGELDTQDLVDLARSVAGNQPGVAVVNRLIALH
jgi:osmotically-inducible protein OsmY